MSTEKDTKSLFLIFVLVFMILCATVMVGIYMNNRWKRMRDIRRRGDLQQIIKVIDMYALENNGNLPENETNYEWDSSFDPKSSNQILFKTLKEKKLLSTVFDPVNNKDYQYRYHKFQKGEYGCDRSFAIFQVTSFEDSSENIGSGSCPERDFTKEAPNGFTIQWFE
ncbi:MAG TPA: hypothetical protein PKL13_03055 [bacterium]|nr:hypothetical protein [bacterium]